MEGPPINVIITADKYKDTSVYDLLAAAAKGHIGVDQRLLRAIVDRGEAAVDDIVRFGMENRFEDRIILDEDLIAMIQYLASPKALPFLIEYLRHEPEDPPEDLVHAFLRIGEPAIGPLLELYKELGPDVGGDIAFVLASFRQHDPRILKMLSTRAADDPGDAAFLMGIHGDPAARALLDKLSNQALIDEKLAEKLGSEAEEAISSLELTSDSPDIPEPVSLWDLYPEYIEPVFDVMDVEEKIEFLRSDSAEMRADAATSFIDREIPEEVGEILIELAEKDPNVGVRAVASTALGFFAEEDRVFRLLTAKLADASKPAPERCGALLGIATVAKQHPELRHYFDEFYANPGTCARAIEAMWRSMDTSFYEVYKRHINDADIDIRRQAIKGVGFAEVSSEAPKLVELFRDEEFRLDALFSYALCVPLKRLNRGDMPQLLKKIEDIAGGLSEVEGEAVTTALDTRLILHGQEPVFLNYEDDEEEEEER
ncbi:MAG: hypothetical protein JNK48_20620 [Bryobacterales bacterium]|nr:hypothetical protein [Bryobacterales bacterium]